MNGQVLRLPATPRSERASLSSEVAGYVRELILSGAIRPGQFVRMERIAEAQQVSITPVREALVALASEGFVTSVPRRGFVALPFTRQDVIDIFWAQSQLAGELAARAATCISAQDLAALETIMEECDEAIRAGDADRAGALGHRFHRIINLAAGSERLARMLGGLVRQLPNHFYASIEVDTVEAPNEHRALLAALAARDADRARHLSEEHLEGHATHVIQLLEKRGLWREQNDVTDG